ncbi:class I SAM-dependent methyltransferase [Chryseolinea sp. T2]|uniref:class I SAM-dependent methyltransferase n=1 Tax=Chryseolinea sp. T2 TaxID=3129255 RepID=UPI003076D35F
MVMGVKEHYEHHLGNFYSWMIGDLRSKVDSFSRFLSQQGIIANHGDLAADLAAGHGIQSLALAELGYKVIAIDFNHQLLQELVANAHSHSVEITAINDDIRNVAQQIHNAALITCCGDTVTHLDNLTDIRKLSASVFAALRPGGKAIFSFRDYATPLLGDRRFIPVKSDENRILTCILDYNSDSVTVTDLLLERTEAGWHQSVSSYSKVRLDRNTFISILTGEGFEIELNDFVSNMITVLAVKPAS